MNGDNRETERKKIRADRLNIGACIYTPQVPKRGLPEYMAPSRAEAPVAAGGECIASRAVLPLGPSGGDLESLVRSALGRSGAGEVETRLDALIQTIAESGEEMLPLLRALREKAAGDPRLSGVADALQDRLGREAESPCAALAPREKEVLELAARGESNADIARGLNLRTITVAKALSRAYRKLDAKNRTDAVHKWMLLRASER